MTIDFRVRPPFRGFRRVFSSRTSPEATDEKLMEQFIESMDRAGITRAVAVGRFAPSSSSLMSGMVPNDDIASLTQQYPGRFEGLGSVDVRDVPGALKEVDRIASMGLKGVAFDNPLSQPAKHDDDEVIFPIYERLQSKGLIAAITSSGMIGPDISYSNPVHVQRVTTAFPELRIVVPHACWPWTTQMAAVMFNSAMAGTNLYVVPDFYMNPPHTPGRQDYIDLADWGYAHRILFASSFPAQDPAEAVQDFLGITFRHEATRQQILTDNAERLLGEVG